VERRALEEELANAGNATEKKSIRKSLEKNKATKIDGKMVRDSKPKPSGSPSMIKMGEISQQMNKSLLDLGFLDHMKRFMHQDILYVNQGLQRANRKLRELYASFIPNAFLT
jgi:hypothetical protein